MITIQSIKSAFVNNPMVELISYEENENGFELNVEFYFVKKVRDEEITINKLIRISVPKNYPNELPIVSEFGEKTITNYPHLYSNGTFCLGTDIDLRKKLEPKKYAIEDFIQIVAWYLVIESYYSRTGNYIDGDRSHFQEGILETYSELLNLKDVRLLRILCSKYLTTSNKLNNHPCFCQSGVKFKNCHQITIKKIMSRKLMKETFIKDMRALGVMK